MASPKYIALACGGALIAFLSGCATVQTTNTSHTFQTVVVDPGHGGRDSGAVRHYSPAEKVLALDVAQRVNRKLRESQLHTVMTRQSDTFIPLDTRVAIGNAQKNSIFVSIHFNDSPTRGAHGPETFYDSQYALDLAETIESHLLGRPQPTSRGVHVARFRVLRNAEYPSVLVECGFLSNRQEGRAVSSAAYREEMADRIAEAIVDYRYGEGVYRREPAIMAESGQGSSGSAGAVR